MGTLGGQLPTPDTLRAQSSFRPLAAPGELSKATGGIDPKLESLDWLKPMGVVPRHRTATALAVFVFIFVLARLIGAPNVTAADSAASSPAKGNAPLPLAPVVDNLVRRNQERAQALLHSEATRVYRLVYMGFPGDREADMTVEAIYDRPSSKQFKILSQSGSKLIQNRVFKKLLDSEQEATQPAVNAKTQLNRDNYNFEWVSYEPAKTGQSSGQYVLRVSPKSVSKYVYRGQIWVDATDFAVTRIEAEPALNPSFWTKKNEIHHEYQKFQDFWLPVKNESVSYVRLGGRATLTIEYKDYRVTAAHSPAAAEKKRAANQ